MSDAGRGGMSTGELSAAVWSAVLAPAVAQLPGLAARLGGDGGWLAAGVILPGILAVGLLLYRVTNRCREGLAEACCRILGRTPGRALIIIYIVWGVLLAGARLRLCAGRVMAAADRTGGEWFVLLAVVAVAGWLAGGKPAAWGRTAVLFHRGLLLALGTVVVLTVFRIQKEELLLPWTQDVLPGLKAGAMGLGVLCCGIYGGFLMGEVHPTRGGARHWAVGAAVLCAELSLLLVSIFGNLGSELTARLEDPFFTLSRNVGVEGAFQRAESLVSAVWLLADLALLVLVLWAGRCSLAVLCPEMKGRTAVLLGVVLTTAAAMLFREVSAARSFEGWIAPAGNLVLGAAVPVLLLVCGWRRGISCACGEQESEDIDEE